LQAQSGASLQTLDGRTLALSSFQGKAVILLFAGVQDPQCRDEFKALQSLRSRYDANQVEIFWVCINPVSVASDERLKNPCGSAGSIAVLRDPNQSVFKRFAGPSPQLPTLVLLDARGQTFGQPRGGFNPNSDFVNDLADSIEKLSKIR
jgi:peroxiredoxin